MSRGTREQLYLSLRFGLIREFGERAESLPVIVDEVLVNFDPDRAQRAAEAFAELSLTNLLLVFTFPPSTVEAFTSAHPGARGFGLPPEVPSWGGMLSREGREFMEMAPRLALWPGLCLTITVYCFNMFGDAMRDLLDPRLRGGER